MRFSWRMNRKQKVIAGVMLAVFFIAASFRVITERAFLAQASIEGAFMTLKPEKSEGTVTLTGQFTPPPYGFAEKKLISHFGEQIGLSVDGDIREVHYEGRIEHVYEKEAAEAHSIVRLVYLTDAKEYYICAEITLSGKNAVLAADFRKTMVKAAEKTGLEEVRTTLELCGIYNGEIPLAKKDELTNQLLKELYAQPVYENRENAEYTVYAYTGAEEEYIVVEKKKINVQVAIYYDQSRNQTEVILASPIGLR